MTELRLPIKRVLAIGALMMAACSPATVDDADLVVGIEAFEQSIEDQTRDVVQRLLNLQVKKYKGRSLSVQKAVVASVYTRENESHIYFGTNYDEGDHLFLREIDPPLHESLVNHSHWVSVVKTYASRQLSFELPVDLETFERLEQGREIAFSCKIAALIRGKSVYCEPTELVVYW